MKLESLKPVQGQFTFEEADRLINFAAAHGMGVRGHTLVWHNQTPQWVFENQDGSLVDRETLLTWMQNSRLAVLVKQAESRSSAV